MTDQRVPESLLFTVAVLAGFLGTMFLLLLDLAWRDWCVTVLALMLALISIRATSAGQRSDANGGLMGLIAAIAVFLFLTNFGWFLKMVVGVIVISALEGFLSRNPIK